MSARAQASAAGSERLRMLDAYDFELPPERIAQQPAEHREAARLMVIDRGTGQVVEAGPSHRVDALPRWLRPGDLLVVNVTRVLPARLVGAKASGGHAEALLLGRPHAQPDDTNDYLALVKCRGRLRVGLAFDFDAIVSEATRAVDEPSPSATPPAQPIRASIVALLDKGEVQLRFEAGVDPYAHGRAPLPPYIKRPTASAEAASAPAGPAPGGLHADRADLDRYQTVYAREPGAVAAPTAGLHLTEALLARLRDAGVEIAEVVLHVGAGTFRPLDEHAFSSGRLHAERFALPEQTAEAIARTRARGGRVVAVGTTTTRVLESRATDAGRVEPGSGETDLFLRPGDGPPFRVVDALLTNFHLPRSSLLLLVAAFVGRAPLLAAYREAIDRGFRFYSYGDAMLIAPNAEASDG